MKLWVEKQEDVAQIQDLQDSQQEARLRSKYLYKIFLLLTKYNPFVILIAEILYSIFCYYNLNTEIINLIGCVSIIHIVYLYVGSYLFNFCKWYRYALNIIVLTNCIALIDMYIGIPLDNLNMLRLYVGILIIGLLCYIKFIYNKNP